MPCFAFFPFAFTLLVCLNRQIVGGGETRPVAVIDLPQAWDLRQRLRKTKFEEQRIGKECTCVQNRIAGDSSRSAEVEVKGNMVTKWFARHTKSVLHDSPETNHQTSSSSSEERIEISFCGKQLHSEPDSQVYLACNLKHSGQPAVDPANRVLAIKIVTTNHWAIKWHIAKPEKMIDHELSMLLDFNEAQKHGAYPSVVELVGGGKIKDRSPLLVAYRDKKLIELKREHTVIFEMEFGDQTLDKHLEGLETRWKQQGTSADEVQSQLVALISSLVGTLDRFHKYAIHLHLKPGNWILVGDRWKFIDLQSAIPVPALRMTKANGGRFGGREKSKDLMEFACNSLNNELFFVKWFERANNRPTTYASPEHADACHRAFSIFHSPQPRCSAPIRKLAPIGFKAMRDRHWTKYLAGITEKADIWSLGVLILEVLSHTPQLQAHIPNVNMDVIFGQLHLEFTAHHFSEQIALLLLHQRNTLQNRASLQRKVQEHFPSIYEVVAKIFESVQPERRPDTQKILKMLIK